MLLKDGCVVTLRRDKLKSIREATDAKKSVFVYGNAGGGKSNTLAFLKFCEHVLDPTKFSRPVASQICGDARGDAARRADPCLL
jgi:hypothetical protein